MYNYPDELYHHGIKGQRWGKRNGPPYPLNPQTHASVVRSASRGGSGKKNGKIGGLKEDLYNTERKRARNRNIASGILAADAAIGAARAPRIIRSTYETSKSVFGPEKAKKAALATGLLSAGVIGAEGLAAYKLRKSAKKHAADAERISKSKIKGRIGGYNEDKEARRRKIARNIAIGAGAAALAGTGYLAYRNRGAIANKARAVGNDIRDRAYIEKEIAKSRMGNLKGKAKDLGGRMRADALIARGKAEDSFVRNANKVRNSINTGRYAANRGSRYLKSLAADKYGYRAVNTITRGTKLAAKGAALGAAGKYIYKKRKKRRR